MKNYDFSKVVDRRHSGSVKWDHFADDEVLPLWVADMDFQAAPAIFPNRKRLSGRHT